MIHSTLKGQKRGGEGIGKSCHRITEINIKYKNCQQINNFFYESPAVHLLLHSCSLCVVLGGEKSQEYHSVLKSQRIDLSSSFQSKILPLFKDIFRHHNVGSHQQAGVIFLSS